MPRRNIIRMHQDENPSCWRKFCDGLICLLKACLPCCCFVAKEAAEVAANGATLGVAHLAGVNQAIDNVAAAGEQVGELALDRAGDIGRAQPTDHLAITQVANVVEDIVDGAEAVGKAVVTNAADKVIGDASKPAVHIAINQAFTGVEGITDGIISRVEQGAVVVSDVLGAVREAFRQDVHDEVNLLRGVPQEVPSPTGDIPPEVQVRTEEHKPAEEAPPSPEQSGGMVGFAWAVFDELRTTARNELNLVLGGRPQPAAQSHTEANVNASHPSHIDEDTHLLVAPLDVHHTTYMATGITDSSGHIA